MSISNLTLRRSGFVIVHFFLLSLCCDSQSKASSEMKTGTFVHGVARSWLHEVARSCPKLVARSCSTLLKPTRPSKLVARSCPKLVARSCSTLLEPTHPSKLVARSCSKLVARSCTELPEVARSSQRWAGCRLCLTCRTQLQFESISGKHTEQFGNQARCQSKS